jgi:competence protein ComEC
MSTRQPVYAFLLSFAAAICALRWWQSAAYPIELWMMLGVAAIVCLCFMAWGKTRKPGTVALAGTLGIAAAFLAVMRTTHVAVPEDIDWYADDTSATVEGRIVTIDARETSIRYTIAATRLIRGEAETKVHGKLLLIDRMLWPRHRYGDTLRAAGKLEKPEAFDGFAYDDYLSAFGTYALMRPGKLTVASPAEGFSILGFLSDLRSNTSERIGLIVPEPHASLLDGLLTGNRASVPQSVLNDFTTAGLTHMLAISGYNIAVVLTVIGSLLFFLPLRWRLIPSILAIAAFTIFTGASASVTRAAIMGTLGLIALHSGRVNETRLAVLWTAFFMLIINPRQAWFDPSFQLSFFSVAGLIELQPLIAKRLTRIPETLGLRDSLALTIAAQLFAAPWAALLFKQVSIIAPLANMIVAPLVPLAMMVGFIAVMLGILWLPLGMLAGAAAWAILELMLRLAHLFSLAPMAALHIPSLAPWHIALYYAALIGTLGSVNILRKTRL